MGAYYRGHADKDRVATVSHLDGPGHHLLMTRIGPVDILGALARVRVYEDLLPHTIELEIAPDIRVKVLDLRMLIELKEELGSEKDLAVLPILRRTLEERERNS
jgi:hypothetical protein